MERKIGDIFEINKKKYKVINAPNAEFCDGCSFEKELECFFLGTLEVVPQEIERMGKVLFLWK